MDNLLELVNECDVEKFLESDHKFNIIEDLQQLGFDYVVNTVYQKEMKLQKLYKISEYNYKVITTKKIREFLKRKVNLYDRNKYPSEEHLDISFDYTIIEFDVLYEDGSETQSAVFYFESYSDVSMFEKIFNFLDKERVKKAIAIKKHGEKTWIYRSYKPRALWSILADRLTTTNLLESNADIISERTCDYNKNTGIGQFKWVETPISEYKSLPPKNVIENLKIHKKRNIFDYFTIGKVKNIPDPLLLGRIKEDKDRRWYIDQWGSDVSLDDLI